MVDIKFRYSNPHIVKFDGYTSLQRMEFLDETDYKFY